MLHGDGTGTFIPSSLVISCTVTAFYFTVTIACIPCVWLYLHTFLSSIPQTKKKKKIVQRHILNAWILLCFVALYVFFMITEAAASTCTPVAIAIDLHVGVCEYWCVFWFGFGLAIFCLEEAEGRAQIMQDTTNACSLCIKKRELE